MFYQERMKFLISWGILRIYCHFLILFLKIHKKGAVVPYYKEPKKLLFQAVLQKNALKPRYQIYYIYIFKGPLKIWVGIR